MLYLSPSTGRLSSAQEMPRERAGGHRNSRLNVPAPTRPAARAGRKRPLPPALDAVTQRAGKLHTTLLVGRLGFLLRAHVTDLTRRRYEEALAGFVAFAGPDADIVRHPWVPHDRVDALLEKYLEHLFHLATSKARAS